MKKVVLIFIITFWGITYSFSQTIAYRSLKDLLVEKADTLEYPLEITVMKRNKNQFMFTGGGDYKIRSNWKKINNRIKRRYYAININEDWYVNCKKLKIKGFRFGRFYAPAMWVNGQIYFTAVPIGPAAASIATKKDAGMGFIEDAINNSSMVSQRAVYEINTETGIVEFVGKDKMKDLLTDYPDLSLEFMKANNEEAKTVEKFLLELKKRKK